MAARRPYFAREGWLYFAGVLLVSALLVANFGWPAGIPLWALAAFVIYLFRDPQREIPAMPLAVVSPADGEVTSVERVTDPHLDREAQRICIRTSRLGSYATRSPVEGTLAKVWPGVQGTGQDVFKTPYCSTHGFTVWLQTDEKDDVVVLMYGAGLRKPRCYVNLGDRLGQGRRCGFLPFGACIDVLLPANASICVKPGSSVSAGTSILGSLVHERR